METISVKLLSHMYRLEYRGRFSAVARSINLSGASLRGYAARDIIIVCRMKSSKSSS